jgi:hypothetical protein
MSGRSRDCSAEQSARGRRSQYRAARSSCPGGARRLDAEWDARRGTQVGRCSCGLASKHQKLSSGIGARGAARRGGAATSKRVKVDIVEG